MHVCIYMYILIYSEIDLYWCRELYPRSGLVYTVTLNPPFLFSYKVAVAVRGLRVHGYPELIWLCVHRYPKIHVVFVGCGFGQRGRILHLQKNKYCFGLIRLGAHPYPNRMFFSFLLRLRLRSARLKG